MRILFLDIDGVLNSDEWDNTDKEGNKDFLEEQFDPKAVSLLNKLVKTLDVHIVLTSTWRLNFNLIEMNALFQKVGLQKNIHSFTPNLLAGIGHNTRGNEILKWCIDNESTIQTKALHYTDYLILDDNKDFLLAQRNNFFRTDKKVGLTTAITDKIIKKFS